MATSTKERRILTHGGQQHRISGKAITLALIAAACWAAMLLQPSAVCAQRLDELSLKRWELLTETQRYQMQIAEKYYREKNYKVAAAEYEKYLTLYESSDAAPYAQLIWSVCQVQQRKSNTAIKEGFKSVIDYWPKSPDAIAAQYYIGDTYRGMGRIPEAKKALKTVVSDQPEHPAAVMAAPSLITIAQAENDDKTLVAMWEHLTFDVKRTKGTARQCVTASEQLAAHLFTSQDFAGGVQALETSHPTPAALQSRVVAVLQQPLVRMAVVEETATQAKALAEKAVSWLQTQRPADLAEEADKKLAFDNSMLIAAVYAYGGVDEKTPLAYENTLKQFGQNDQVLAALAAWFSQKKRYDEARAVYRRYEDKAAGLAQVAMTYRAEGDVDAAVKSYQQAIAADPERSVTFKAQIAATYRSVKKYAEAIASYEELLAEDLEHAESWRWQVASAHQDWGKYKEAIAHYRQCTNFPENYKQMAWCNRQLKNFQEAIVLYTQVLAHEPSAPWALLQIGYTREQASQKEQAIKTFQLVCKKFPKDRHASVAHAHLQDAYKISVTLGGAKDE